MKKFLPFLLFPLLTITACDNYLARSRVSFELNATNYNNFVIFSSYLDEKGLYVSLETRVTDCTVFDKDVVLDFYLEYQYREEKEILTGEANVSFSYQDTFQTVLAVPPEAVKPASIIPNSYTITPKKVSGHLLLAGNYYKKVELKKLDDYQEFNIKFKTYYDINGVVKSKDNAHPFITYSHSSLCFFDVSYLYYASYEYDVEHPDIEPVVRYEEKYNIATDGFVLDECINDSSDISVMNMEGYLYIFMKQ